jgi:MFS family permease
VGSNRQRIARSVLLVAGLGTFLAQLDGTVMNVALPTLSRAFHAGGLSSVQPVITAYLVTVVALLPILGKLADRYGRKPLFLIGFAVFGLSSLGAAWARSLALLIGLRLLQASGGALLSGTGLALVAGAGDERRGEALGRLSVVYALAGLLGPPVGGALVQFFGWPAVFWINVPLSAAGLLLGVLLLPSDTIRASETALDWPGAVLFAASSGLLVAGVAAAGQHGRLVLGNLDLAWPIVVLAGLAAYLLLGLWERETVHRHIDGVLDLTLLRSRAYGLGLFVAFVNNGLSIGLFVLVPFWLAKGWHVAAAMQGLVFIPVAVGLGALAPVAGKRSDTMGARMLTAAGMLIGGLAALLLAWQATELWWPAVLLGMLLLGVASGLFVAPNNNAVLAAVPERQLAAAGSMLSAARTLGVIVSVGGFGAAYDTLRSSLGSNPAARMLFLVAAAIYLLNAATCWVGREAPHTVVSPIPPRSDGASSGRRIPS